MKISCKMAEDLMPLYLDGICSEDSRTALEEHLETCEACWERLRRMGSSETAPKLEEKDLEVLAYAKKVKKHRLRSVILFLCVLLVSTLVLTMVCLACEDMMRLANPIIYETEEGVWNLTANPLEISAEDAKNYILFTNNTKVAVRVSGEGNFSGRVELYNAEDMTNSALAGEVSPENTAVTFSYLTSGELYVVSCEGQDGMTVTITDGRIINFWYSLQRIIADLVSSVFS